MTPTHTYYLPPTLILHLPTHTNSNTHTHTHTPHTQTPTPTHLPHTPRRCCQPQCVAFEVQFGEILAVGFRNGDVKILGTETLQDLFSFCPSSDAVLFLKFSPSGTYLAGYDEGNHTLLFKR